MRATVVGLVLVSVGCGPLMTGENGATSGAADTSASDGSTSGPSAGVTGPATGGTGADPTHDDEDGGDGDDDGGDGQAKLDVSGECRSSDDCVLLDTCCRCDAAPSEPPDRCPIECAEGQCSALGVDAPACVFGRCVTSRDCDTSGVRCDATPPPCSDGLLPSVLDGCWGACLPASTCLAVASCEDCPDDHVCVPLPDGAVRCAELDPKCATMPPTCDCIDPLTCLELVMVDCFDTDRGPACELVGGDPPG